MQSQTHRGIRRAAAALVAALLLLAALPRPASAAGECAFAVEGSSDYTFDALNGVLHITRLGNFTISMVNPGAPTSQRIVVDAGGGGNITLDNLWIEAANGPAFQIADNSRSPITLRLRGESTLSGGENAAGLQKGCTHPDGNCDCSSLMISCEEIGDHQCDDSLRATGGSRGAGIGGGNGQSSRKITIFSGHITAQGGTDAAGIGGGQGGSGQYISVINGRVKADGAGGGAGIGGGRGGNGRGIAITGGETEAGGVSGAGIGGGSYAQDLARGGEGSTISISGGRLLAGSATGAGIGGGWGGSGTDIHISGGTVACSAEQGAAIGGGGFRGQAGANSGRDIEISGGYVVAQAGMIGIGAPMGGDASNIHISGGTIYADGSYSGFGIGNYPPAMGGSTTNVTISGGNLCAGNDNHPQDLPIKTQPTNGQSPSQEVQLYRLVFPKSWDVLSDEPGVNWQDPVANLVIEGAPYYGTKDMVINQDGEILLWLPEGCAVQSAEMADGTVYHPVTVQVTGSGKVSANHPFAAQGNRIALQVEPEAPNRLASLQVNGQEIQQDQGGYQFDMPNQAALITATFDQKLALTVTGGSGSGRYLEGERLTIAAGPAPDGQVFDRWELVSGDGLIADPAAASTAFTMGAGDCAVAARYKAAPATVDPEGENPPKTPDEKPGENPPEAPPKETGGQGDAPRTGDPTAPLWGAAALAGALILAGRLLRRRAAEKRR